MTPQPGPVEPDYGECLCNYCTEKECWKNNRDAAVAAKAKAEEREKVLKLFEPFEWSGSHTDYEDSWGVFTKACPFCFNAKVDGHKSTCLFESLRISK